MGRTSHSLLAAAMAACLAFPFAADQAQARVTGFTIVSQRPVFEGRTFGAVGAYERIDAIAEFAVDPDEPRLDAIVGVDDAPVNAEGDVEFSANVTILKPADPARASGLLFYEIANRGRSISPILLNLAPGASVPDKAADAGDGFQMLRGDTIVWSGWQADVAPGLFRITLPVLEGKTGLAREQVVFDRLEDSSTLALKFPMASLDPSAIRVTVQAGPDAPAVPLAFVIGNESQITITRSKDHDAGAIHEVVYTAKNPVPAGLGFAAVSDLNSFLRGLPGHEAMPPLKNIRHTVVMGISQSGRFLRDFLYHGFNADGLGRKVFDGAMVHVAGSRKIFLNYPFSQPGRYSRQHEEHDYPGDQFPFSYAMSTDPLTNRSDSVLARCEASRTCPKLMHSDSSTEFWQARSALITLGPDGAPLTMPENVRLYGLASVPHLNTWTARPTENASCLFAFNPLSPAPVMRALYDAMAKWVEGSGLPPESRFPSLADGTLVPHDGFTMPLIGGVHLKPPYNVVRVENHTAVPPLHGAAYPAFVPAVDQDGLETGGIRLPAVAAPAATYLGWNLRRKGYAEGALCGLAGSYIPLPRSILAEDVRKPFAQRYASKQAYLAAVEGAAKDLIKAGYMLEADMGLVVERAKEDAAALP
ncbi:MULTISPECIES: alpha/beta hydrolase domain-containing protein [unclassified Pannonibacter]|uniref:alpha/beta hydrolase domain-containing protein n=1 Tax=unclassified Pannonibacter TaxID=2627228 RepID=UPI001648B60F|nr:MULTISPECIES: alpha/beta hydrolase domain-containing protein [unclassified Pannonibacter]